MRKKLGSIIAILVMLISIMTSVQAIENEEEILRRLNSEIDENLISTKYLVTDDTIQRVRPETKVSEIKEEWKDEKITIYEDITCQKEVAEGNVGTGMALKVSGWEKVYTISVIGDMDKDGIANQIELSKIIREVKEIEGCRLQGIDKISADITGDRKVDAEDVETLINYIVFGRLEIDLILEVKSPKVEVISGEEDEGYYITNVGIKITEENKEEETEKTVYKITGTKEQNITEIENGSTVELSEDGIYKITSYTYGKLGNRSRANSIIVKLQRANERLYKVEHYKEELDGTYILADTDNLKGIIGKEVTAVAKSYTGFSEDIQNENRIASGVVAEDKALTLKLYYNRNSYELKLEKGDNIKDVTGAGTYKYGETIGINASLQEDVGYVYFFDKWISSNKELIADNNKQEAAILMPAGDITLTATAIKAESEYSISYVIYDKDNVIINTNPSKYQVGQETSIEKLSNAEQTTIERESFYTYGEVYKFLGWYLNENYEGENITKINSSYFGDITLYAKWGEVVAKILETGETYTTLKDAIDACEVNGEKRTIQILKSIEEQGIIEAGKDIIIDLNGKEITSDNEESTIINNGTLQIIDDSKDKTGSIKNSKNTAIKNKETGILILGNNDGQVIKQPVIEGESSGVENNGTFNFYDGSIIGIKAINGNVNETPQNYKVIVSQEGSKQIATLEIMSDAEARIGDNYYTQLERAVQQAKTGETIVLLKNKMLAQTLVISNDKDIVLDLNSYQISTIFNGDAIENNGILEVVDNSEEKTGEVSATAGNVIVNNQDTNFKMSSGEISCTSLNAITSLGKVEITGGTINGGTYGIYSEGDQIKISGGTISCVAGSSNKYGIYNKNDAQIDITGGEINSIYNNDNGNININGGTTGTIYNYAGKVEITDGTISGTITNGANGNINQTNGNVNKIESYGMTEISGGNTNYVVNPVDYLKVTAGDIQSIANGGTADILGGTIISIDNTGKTTIESGNVTKIVNGSVRGIPYITDSNMVIKNINMENNFTLITNYAILEIQKGIIRNTGTNGYGIVNYGTLNIYGGIIESAANYAIYNAVYKDSIIGEVNVGEVKEDTIDSPEIIGNTYGIYMMNNKCIFNFYNGAIKGDTNAIYGYVNEITENKQIIMTQEEEKEVARIGVNSEKIARVGENEYTTLQEAIDACGDAENTITILKDFYITSNMDIATIQENQNIVLDLNGKNIKSYKSGINIENLGKLKITDLQEGAKGTITNAIINNSGVMKIETVNLTYTLEGINAITNSESLELDGGNIILSDKIIAIYNIVGSDFTLTEGNIEIENEENCTVIYVEGVETEAETDIEGAKIEINGGSIVSNTKYGLIELYGKATTLNINGGTIKNTQINNKGTGEVKMSGGSITEGGISNQAGTVIIEGGTIQNNDGGAIYKNRGKIVIEDGTIIGDIYYSKAAIQNEIGGILEINGGYIGGITNYGNATIKGGTIRGKERSIYIESGELTLGENDGEVSQTSPVIVGGQYGVYKNSGIFNYYDGVISGVNNAIYGGTDKIAYNYEIIKTTEENEDLGKETETTRLQLIEPIASVGENKFVTLQAAIDACGNQENTIKILRNFELLSSITSYEIGENQNIRIDLNGNTITYNNEYIIKNSGSLEIDDSSTDASGTLYGVNMPAIYNKTRSSFKLQNGNINIPNASNVIAIYAEAGSDIEIVGGKIETNGGKILLEGEKSSLSINGGKIVNTVIYNNGTGNVKITNGEITSGSYSTIQNVSTGNILIEGGNIVTSYVSILNSNLGTIKITDGNITTNGKHEAIYNSNPSGIVEITGGQVSSQINRGIKNLGKLVITGGNVTGRVSAIYNYATGNVQLGLNDGEVSTDLPKIIGGNYGVYNDNAIFNYYDGVISGSTNAVYGTITSVADEHEIIRSVTDDIETAILEELQPIAQVDENQYTTLQEAIYACEDTEKTIKILRDFEIQSATASSEIGENQNIHIDLNGNTVTNYNDYVIKNNGILEITDNSEESRGTLCGSNASVIYNLAESKFTISKGKVELQGTQMATAIYGEEKSQVEIAKTAEIITHGSYKYNPNLIETSGKLLISGGKIKGADTTTAEGKGGINVKESASNLEMTGGTLENCVMFIEGTSIIKNADMNNVFLGNYGNTTIENINTIDGSLDNYKDLVIKGGNIESEYVAISNSYQGNLKVTGGTIKSAYSYAIYNGSGTTTLGEKDGKVNNEQPKIVGTKYGINAKGGTFNYYDGLISGGTKAIYGLVTTLEDGYKIETKTIDEMEIAELKIISTEEAVAKVGDIYYVDLQVAINSCPNEVATTIQLLKNIDLESNITIGEGKDIILDINGNTINNQGSYYIYKQGTIQVVDTTGGDTSDVQSIIKDY